MGDDRSSYIVTDMSPAAVKALTEGNPDIRSGIGQVRELLREEYVATDETDYDVITTFILGTYLFTAVATVPFLMIYGPPGSAKSRLGEFIATMAFNGHNVVTPTLAAVSRIVDVQACTLVFDEAEWHNPDLRNELLCANQRGARVPRCVPGEELPRFREVYSPRVFISIAEPDWDAFRSRTIPISAEPLDPRTVRVRRRTSTRDRQAVQLLRDSLHQLALTISADVAEEYGSAPAVPGSTGRDDDVVALPLAVAAVLDRHGIDPGFHERLLGRFRRLVEKRKRARGDDEQHWLARLVIEFERSPRAVAIAGTGDDRFFEAATFTAFVNERRVFDRPRLANELSRRLGGLIAEKRRLDLAPATPKLVGMVVMNGSGTGNTGSRQQARCWRFNFALARRLEAET